VCSVDVCSHLSGNLQAIRSSFTGHIADNGELNGTSVCINIQDRTLLVSRDSRPDVQSAIDRHAAAAAAAAAVTEASTLNRVVCESLCISHFFPVAR
jgi:hypothetical protein